GMRPGGFPEEAQGGGESAIDPLKTQVFPLAEPFQLMPESRVGKIKDVMVSREKIIRVLSLERNATIVKAIGTKLGTVRVTIIGQKDQTQDFIVRIVPS